MDIGKLRPGHSIVPGVEGPDANVKPGRLARASVRITQRCVTIGAANAAPWDLRPPCGTPW
jgi:hypothetical protein